MIENFIQSNSNKISLLLPDKAIRCITLFKKNGYECYVVGGFIRDTLLNRSTSNKALDFATNATPQEMLTFLPNAKYENKFGTVIVPLKDSANTLHIKKSEYLENEYFEITTYRSESLYKDKRHPENVTWGTRIEEDLSRRDFTVNALAYDGKRFVDIYNGVHDLKKKCLRAVNNAQLRFEEDALRMLRAVRLASQLQFTIEKETYDALQSKAKNLSFVSAERIRDEFFALLSSKNAMEGLLHLKDTGLLQSIVPELYPTFLCDQKSPKRHHLYDVGTHLIKSLRACNNTDPIVRLATLIHDIGKPKTRSITKEGVVTFYNHEIIGTQMAYEIASRMHLSKKDTIRLTKLVRYHQFSVTEDQTDSALRRLVRNIGKENINDLLDLRVADRIGSGASPSSWRLDLYKKRLIQVQMQPFGVRDLVIDGNDVMRLLNMKPGPKVGKILDVLFTQIEIGKLENKKKVLTEYLKKIDLKALV
ncbi:MAG: CCA tRNA nucleotidyltransferase [Candidatus Roizmanbacteria bacterium]|nr:CCA tRNA nucleotidyltransferase [Candidatus Roizmanbacteria bacterium]